MLERGATAANNTMVSRDGAAMIATEPAITVVAVHKIELLFVDVEK